MKPIPIQNIHIPFKDQPKHYKLYRDFVTVCKRTARSQSATLRMLMQRFIDEEGK